MTLKQAEALRSNTTVAATPGSDSAPSPAGSTAAEWAGSSLPPDSAGPGERDSDSTVQLDNEHERPAGPAPFAGFPPGTTIGHYRITRRLGAGGMGEVYEAEQERPRRTVALKVLRCERLDPATLRRFEYEAEILARVRHPGIAEVYEAGTQAIAHDQGEPCSGAAAGGELPYYAMELVSEGRPVTEYAVRAGLSTEQCVALFIEVCEAVEAAHQHGVIHRDLKPANILVGRDGQPKLIDFGVARVTQALGPLETLHTLHGQLVGTLKYMSPEQCGPASNDVDVRTDVYALGVVLYELLTRELPYDLASAPMHDIGRIIREKPPIPLSRKMPAVGRDLELVVLKALSKEPAARYRSAIELGDDLRRYLAHEPVQARAPSAAYRLRMFARRRKGLVASVAAAVVLLIAGGAALTVMYVQASTALRELEAARRAEQEQSRLAAQAREELAALRRQLERTADRTSPGPALPLGEMPAGGPEAAIGAGPLAREIVAAAADSVQAAGTREEKSALVASAFNTLQRLERQLPADEATLEALAAAYQRVGDLHGADWESLPQDVENSADAYRRAVELRRQLAGADQRDAGAAARLVDAQLRLAEAFRKLGSASEGLAVANQAVSGALRLRRRNLYDLDAGLRLAWALLCRGDVRLGRAQAEAGNAAEPAERLVVQGESASREVRADIDRGISDIRDALRVGEQLEMRYPKDARVLNALAWSHFRMGIWLRRGLGNLEAGLTHQQLSNRYRVRYCAARPRDAAAVATLLSTCRVEIEYLRELGRHDEALDQLDQYRSLAEPLLEEDPEQRELLAMYWAATEDIIRQRSASGELQQALAHCRKTVDLAECARAAINGGVDGPDHPANDFTVLIDILVRASSAARERDPQLALQYARRASDLDATGRADVTHALEEAMTAAGVETPE